MTLNGSRTLVIAGLVLMLAGALDPLEGSVVILGGSALAAAGAFFGKTRRYRLQVTASVLIAIGVSYPVGWVIGLVGAVALLREARHAPA